jgi:hypothetical protein
MTQYERLLTEIKDHLFTYYSSGSNDDGWDEADANESAHMIVEIVKKFESIPTVAKWRATD